MTVGIKKVLFSITEKSVQTTVTTSPKRTTDGKGFCFCVFFFLLKCSKLIEKVFHGREACFVVVHDCRKIDKKNTTKK